jgi:hypothetical protein
VNVALRVVIAAALSGILFILAMEKCNTKPVVSVDSTSYLKDQIDALRNYIPKRYTDTIQLVRDRYRDRILQVDRWVYDTVRNILCDSFAGGKKDTACQRFLARRLATSELNATLIDVYQSQRTEDSLQIGVLMKLDSLNSELTRGLEIKLKAKDGEILQAKKDSRRNGLKIGLGGFVAGALIGIIVK